MRAKFGEQGGGGAAALAWHELTTDDFVGESLTPFKDPNSVLSSITEIGSGVFEFVLTEKGTAYDAPSTAAMWRLKWPTGYLGAGDQGLAVRVTPITNPSKTSKPCVAFFTSDSDGDPSDVAAQCLGHGIGWTSATQVGIHIISSRTAGTTTGGQTFSGNSPSVLSRWIPNGETGDNSSVGASDGFHGMWIGAMRVNPDDPTAQAQNGDGTTVEDGFYLCLLAGFDATGVGTATLRVKLEIALIDISPDGSYTP